MDGYVFRKADISDLDSICHIINGAKERMRLAGRTQWQGEYPSSADIEYDIRRGLGYVLSMPDCIVAYCAVSFDGEPAYEALDGEWLSCGRYVVVHRLAVAETMLGRGAATICIEETGALALSRGVGSFKVDTNHDNLQMRHILSKAGFVRCGTVRYQDGPRIAYEKRLGAENLF